MIHSLFLSTEEGDVFMEKHWRGVIKRVAVEPVLEHLRKATSAQDVPPVVVANKNCLISIVRDKVLFIAVVQREISPLFVIEFLTRVADTIALYFGDCRETTIKDGYVTVYEILEEMCDNGFPMTTEPCVLKDLVAMPKALDSLLSSMTGEVKSNIKSAAIGQASAIPWRREGIVHGSNEILFDFVERLDQVLDRNGRPMTTDVTGEIICTSKLSGMPDLTLSFQNSRLIEDLAFHPCVRINRWERDHVISFIPPDGQFKLATYASNASTMSFQCPVVIDPKFTVTDDTIRFEIGVRLNTLNGKMPTHVSVLIPLPPCTQTVDYETSNDKISCNYDIKNQVLRWQAVGGNGGGPAINTTNRNSSGISGKIASSSKIYIKGTARLVAHESDIQSPHVGISFETAGALMSGIKVDSVGLKNESYNMFKGVKLKCKAGKILYRT